MTRAWKHTVLCMPYLPQCVLYLWVEFITTCGGGLLDLRTLAELYLWVAIHAPKGVVFSFFA